MNVTVQLVDIVRKLKNMLEYKDSLMTQREIKFRYVWQHEDTGNISMPIFSLYRISAEGLSGVDRHVVIGIDQYTGLKDKNGKEIYENDIVITEYGEDKHTDTVIWENSSAIFTLEKDGDLLNEYLDLEVIGNIYENKDLIK